MKKTGLFLIGILSCTSLWAQDDFGSILSVEVTKKITKGLNLSFEEEHRSHSNFSATDRFSHCLELSYKPISVLKVGGAYNPMNYNRGTKGWELRHRYYFYATGYWDVGRFTVSLRERFQSTKRQGVTETAKRANPKLYLRSRLSVDYNIRKSKFEPFATVELFNTLNDPQNNRMDRVRLTAGTSYKLKKNHSVQLYYRYTNNLDEDEVSIHHVGAGYAFKF